MTTFGVIIAFGGVLAVWAIWVIRGNMQHITMMKEVLERLQKSAYSFSNLTRVTGYEREQLTDVLRTLREDHLVTTKVEDFNVYYDITDKGREWFKAHR